MSQEKIDPIRSSEEAGNQCQALLKNIGGNLEKIRATTAEVSSKPTGGSGLYARGDVPSISEKREHFAQNLDLVNKGLEKIDEELQQLVTANRIERKSP